jgi:hypothetical protein
MTPWVVSFFLSTIESLISSWQLCALISCVKLLGLFGLRKQFWIFFISKLICFLLNFYIIHIKFIYLKEGVTCVYIEAMVPEMSILTLGEQAYHIGAETTFLSRNDQQQKTIISPTESRPWICLPISCFGTWRSSVTDAAWVKAVHEINRKLIWVDPHPRGWMPSPSLTSVTAGCLHHQLRSP